MQRQSLDKIIQQAILWTIILYIKHDDRDTHDWWKINNYLKIVQVV